MAKLAERLLPTSEIYSSNTVLITVNGLKQLKRRNEARNGQIEKELRIRCVK